MYQFSLQKILDLKEKEKEQSQISLANSIKKLEGELLAHEKLLKDKDDVESRLKEKQQEAIQISDLVQWHNFKHKMDQHIQKSMERIEKAEQEVEKRRDHVEDKVKEEKIYQLIKTREFNRYKYEQNRHEQLLLDEISLNFYNRDKS